MKISDEIIQTGKERTDRIKSFLEELEVQMALGKAEARDAFEDEKKNFRKFLNSYKAKMAEQADTVNENRQTLNQKFSVLDELVSQEFPTAKRKFDKFKKETLQAIFELEFAMKETQGEIGTFLQEQLDRFKDKLDTYRVQLALSSNETDETLENRKAELHNSIVKIQDKLQEEMQKGSKAEHFVDEISDSFNKMKNAFSDLFA